MRIQITKFIFLTCVTLIVATSHQVKAEGKFNLETYGAQPLYYSKEAVIQRQEMKALNEANYLAGEQLAVENERLTEQKEMDDRIKQELDAQ